jgi:hypothetical protein
LDILAKVTGNKEAGMIDDSGRYASTAGGEEGIPAPPQDQELLLEAWREALAEVLHTRDNEWRAHQRAMKAEGRAAVAELRANAAEICGRMETMIEQRLAQIRLPADGLRGEPGPSGEPGPPGKIERLYEYVEDAVRYRGDVVTHRGSTYQAQCDTAREPPHDDWVCIASAGRDGRRTLDARAGHLAGRRELRAAQCRGAQRRLVCRAPRRSRRMSRPGLASADAAGQARREGHTGRARSCGSCGPGHQELADR